MSYNGWKNKETWLVYVHYGPTSLSDLDSIKEDLDSALYDMAPGSILADFIGDAISEIDWRELEEVVSENENEEYEDED